MDITDMKLKRMDGFNDCVIGVAERFGETFIVYSHTKVIKQLMEDDMDELEAKEYYRFNMVGVDVGATTPAFLHSIDIPSDADMELDKIKKDLAEVDEKWLDSCKKKMAIDDFHKRADEGDKKRS